MTQDSAVTPSPRPRSWVYRDIDEVSYITILGSMGARPNSIALVLPGDRWTDVKIGKILKEQLGHGAKHGRRPVVAAVRAARDDVVQRTLAYMCYELVKLFAECEAAAVIEGYELYEFKASSLGYTPISIERFIPFAQGAEKQGLRVVSCKSCSVPRLVESFHVQSIFECEACVDAAKGKRSPSRRMASAPKLSDAIASENNPEEPPVG